MVQPESNISIRSLFQQGHVQLVPAPNMQNRYGHCMLDSLEALHVACNLQDLPHDRALSAHDFNQWMLEGNGQRWSCAPGVLPAGLDGLEDFALSCCFVCEGFGTNLPQRIVPVTGEEIDSFFGHKMIFEEVPSLENNHAYSVTRSH